MPKVSSVEKFQTPSRSGPFRGKAANHSPEFHAAFSAGKIRRAFSSSASLNAASQDTPRGIRDRAILGLLSNNKEWLSAGCSDTFTLPRWAAEVPHPALALRGPRGTHIRAQVEMGMLSRVETLECIKRKEFIIRKRIERQFEEDELWDAVI